MIALSPRAVKRLETYAADRPLPKIFQMSKGGKLIGGIFEGETINTPSMLAVEDYLDTLAWAKQAGGLSGLRARADANAKVIHDWVEQIGQNSGHRQRPKDWSENVDDSPKTPNEADNQCGQGRQGKTGKRQPNEP